MELFGYTLDVETPVKDIIGKGYHTIAVQLPDGLKNGALPLVEYLKKETNAHIILLADPCYGACDLANYELKNLDVDCILHLGHTPISDVENYWIPTYFVNAFSNLDVTGIVEKAVPFLKGKHIGLVTTAQHLHMLQNAAEVLQSHGFDPVIGEGDDRVSEKGQILGCNFSAGTRIMDQVDSFLFIGSGMFHPVGLLLSTKKPVVAADPYTNTVKIDELDELKDIMLKQRYGAIVAARTAKTFGVLVGLKRGQQRLPLAYSVIMMLDAVQKKSVLLATDTFSPVTLQSFPTVDCFISTACPRIAIDDYMQYKKPVITPVELEIALGKRTWDEYAFDQIVP
ncbi:MAG: diphthamide biosynthesis enzyme Dph2 [Methanobacteriota archaeon]